MIATIIPNDARKDSEDPVIIKRALHVDTLKLEVAFSIQHHHPSSSVVVGGW